MTRTAQPSNPEVTLKRTLAALLFVIVSSICWGQTQPYPASTLTLTGRWKITWTEPAGGRPNIINLTETSKKISGTYTADSGESCPIVGDNNGTISFNVQCSTFGIVINGGFDVVEGDVNDTLIVGTYIWNKGKGKFQMDKYVCMIPEGCNDKK
jgi:hypothetical protein